MAYSPTTQWGRSHFTEETGAWRGRVTFSVSLNSVSGEADIQTLKAPLVITTGAWDTAVAWAQESEFLGLNLVPSPAANCALLLVLQGRLTAVSISIGLWKWSDAGKLFNTAPDSTRAVMNYQLLLLPAGGSYGRVWPEGCGPGPGTNLFWGQREICVRGKLWNYGWYEIGWNKNQGINFPKVPFKKW